MRELPKGWLRLPLRDLVGPNGLFSDGDWVESKDQDPNGRIRLLQLADIGDGVFLDRSARYVNEDAFRRLRCTELRPGDVLVARMPDPLGRACITPKLDQRAITVVDVAIVRPGDPAISTGWVKHFLNSPEIRRKIKLLASGTTRRRISRSKLEGIELPVPPPQEQVRIASKLDSLFARLSKCRERLERAPEILERFREAVLEAAVSGRLTEEWRSEAESAATQEVRFDDAIIRMPRSWNVSALSGLISESRPLCYGVVQPGEESPLGVNLIRIQDLERGAIRTTDLRTISAEIDEEYRRSRVEGGDLLVSVVGTIGRTAIVPPNIKANIARAIARIACGSAVDPHWVKLWLDSPTLQWWLAKSAREVARKTLNLSELGKIRVGIPSEREQAAIVRRAETLLSIADSIEDRVQSTLARVNTLGSAILEKAFRGELVAQGPQDEPATEMLELMKQKTEASSGSREGTAIGRRRRKEARTAREGRKRARKSA